MEAKQYKKAVNAWSMYDWANSAFATTIMAGFMPGYFKAMAETTGMTGVESTSAWALVTTIALIIIALSAPVMGYMADRMGGKKKFLTIFAVIGAVASVALYIPNGDMFKLSGAIYIIGNLGFAGANIFANALLPHVAKDEDIDQVSVKGYALGYLGGGLLLVVNVLMFNFPEWFGIPDATLAVRLSFITVGFWWLGFTIPLWKHVKEPDTVFKENLKLGPAFKESFKNLAKTYNKIKQYPEAFKLLLAFWLYNDGIGTIIKMATAFGGEIGIGLTEMIGALVLVQFVGIPFSFAFGWLAKKIGPKKSILIALAVYCFISIGGFFIAEAWHFWTLAFLVALVQGGAQALSRSMFSSMIPKSRSGEFFGFFSMSDKFAGIVGPIVFGSAALIFGSSRFGIVFLLIFFVFGGALLLKVDEKKGMREAQLAEQGSA